MKEVLDMNASESPAQRGYIDDLPLPERNGDAAIRCEGLTRITAQ